MKTHERELLIFYDSKSSTDRKTIAFARSTGHKLKTYDHSKNSATTTLWRGILNSLDKHPKEILNKAHPYYQEHIRGREFDKESWLKVIRYNPDLIKAPIAIRGNRAVLCSNPTDIYQLMEKSAPPV